MSLKSWRVAVSGLCLLAACDASDSDSELGDAGGSANPGNVPGSDAAIQDGASTPWLPGSDAGQQPVESGDAATQGDAAAVDSDAATPGPDDSYDYLMQEVA